MFFLSVLLPRQALWSVELRAMTARFLNPGVMPFIGINAVIFIATGTVCILGDKELCSGGPLIGDDITSDIPVASYWPVALNSLAALMLAFYANTCLGIYKESYSACQAMRAAVIDMVTLACGTIKREHREVLFEFWRCANLLNLCTFVLADKSRETYSFDEFLVPVAEAFGKYDGREHLGMLRASEMREVHGHRRLSMDRAEQPSLSSPVPHVCADDANGKFRNADDTTRDTKPRRGTGDMLAADKAPRCTKQGLARSSTLSNQRGDTQSKAAILHSCISLRLYRLVSHVVDLKLANVAWPVWGNEMRKLLQCSDSVRAIALFRFPRVYRDSVKYFVGLTICVDTLALSARMGQLFQEEYEYRWISGACMFLFDAIVVTFAAFIVSCCMLMEQPFGSDSIDMPGLSYATAAAEISLEIVTESYTKSYNKLSFVDMEEVLGVEEYRKIVHGS
jgi:hypothetical protein